MSIDTKTIRDLHAKRGALQEWLFKQRDALAAGGDQ